MFREKELYFVDIGSANLKIAKMQLRRSPYLEWIDIVNYYQTGLVNRPEEIGYPLILQILKDTVKKRKLAGKNVRTLLSTPNALVRVLKIPRVSEADLKQTIQFNLLGLIPYPPEKSEFDYTIWHANNSDPSQMVIVGIAPKEEINGLSDLLTKANLIPILITIDALAIFNAAQIFLKNKKSAYLILYIGARRSIIIFYKEGQCPFFHITPIGVEAVTTHLARILGTNFTNAELLKTGGIPLPETFYDTGDPISRAMEQAYLNNVLPTLRDTILHLLNNQILTPEDEIKILLTGGGALTPRLSELLQKHLQLEVNIWNPLEESGNEISSKGLSLENGCLFTPIIGLACQEGLCR